MERHSPAPAGDRVALYGSGAASSPPGWVAILRVAADGKVRGVRGFRGVYERPRRAKPLAQEEVFDTVLLDALLQQMPSGVLVAEAPSGRVVRSNRQLARIWRSSDPAGPEAVDVAWEGFRPDGSAYAPGEWPHARALDGQTIESEEIEIVRGDGTRGFVRVSAQPIRENGRVVAAVTTFLDISEQRRRYDSRRFLAEAGVLLSASLDHVETLRNLARLAVPALGDWCVIDLIAPGGGLDRVAVEHIDRRKASVALQHTRRFPPSLETEPAVAHVIRTGRSLLDEKVAPESLERISPDPSRRKFLSELGLSSAMIAPLVARGEPLGAITLATAESGRRYTAEDLEVAEELAARAALAIENNRLFQASRAATEAKSDFLAVMSHELRTPLTAIIGYAELLQLGVPEKVTPRQQEQAERIEVSARELLQLIEEILTLVTLESGERRVRRDEVKVNELIRRAASIVEPMARAKGLPLIVVPVPEDAILETDFDKLLQIVLNLLSNAVKFTDEGEVRLEARETDRTLVIDVVDSGIGLEDDHLGRIFEPFWQVERPITRRAGGTGLGLTISRRLADLLGAELQVRSEAGRGSTFTVRLPL